MVRDGISRLAALRGLVERFFSFSIVSSRLKTIVLSFHEEYNARLSLQNDREIKFWILKCTSDSETSKNDVFLGQPAAGAEKNWGILSI